MEMMAGFPPPAAAQATLANWRTPPFHRWAFQHVREIVPTAEIANDPDRVWRLPAAPRDLSGVTVETADGALGFHDFLAATDTDALVVLDRGQVVWESYANGMTANRPHILMSVSKSVLGMVAGILAGQGVLDPGAAVTRWLPELAGGAYAGATLQQLLDMRAGIAFEENYLATSGPIIAYRKAQGWNPPAPGDPPSDLRSFFATLTGRDGPHGGRFHYVSPNTDILAWVLERAAGERFADLVSRLLWRPLGAQRSAEITVDRLGAPRGAGGMSVAATDLARLGQLLVQDGMRDGVEIVPRAWIDDLAAAADRAAWDAGDFAHYFPGMPIHYRSKWYVLHGEAPLLFCVGVNGQNLFVDRANQLVIAKLSSHDLPMDEARILLTMQGVAALRRHLAAR
ncbi:serine hydrolase domain-containing protein [Stella sp.]|uniref:serine hydrolase domain-containing protein n=1 Tax=Stella sp. TaxID=2912054 RepID=UPI0035AF4718